MKELTARVYVEDKRFKTGERMIDKRDHVAESAEALEEALREEFSGDRITRIKIYDTWKTKRNLLSGEEFVEHADTPYYCSPSSETYWSM